MATNDSELDRPLTDIGAQIGRLLPGLYDVDSQRDVKLSESFDVWTVGIEGLKATGYSGNFPARKTEYQHHQILIDGRARAFASSILSPSGELRVVRVALSPVAEAIDKAITRIDADYPKSSTRVRLLVIQSFSLYAFWLARSGLIYIISVPGLLTVLRAESYYGTADFLGALLRDATHSIPRSDVALESSEDSGGPRW
ncbi:MAG: hypothetical protein AABO57_07270 [Acidobacteriota bacterium]